MKNYHEWFSIKELIDENLIGLPTSDKGIVKKADRENWEKRQRKGVKGKTFEYHYSSLPIEVQQALGFSPVKNLDTKMEIRNEFSDGDVFVNKRRLLSAIETLDKILELTHREMRPKEKAEMTWMIYELLNEDSANDNILNIMKLIA